MRARSHAVYRVLTWLLRGPVALDPGPVVTGPMLQYTRALAMRHACE